MNSIRLSYKIVLSSIIVTISFLVMTSFSYAYYTTEIEGNESAQNVTVKTGDVVLDFQGGENNINLENAYPISNDEGLAGEPYTFSITNQNNYAVVSNIYLNVLNETDDALLSHIKMAFDNGDGKYVTQMVNNCTTTTSPMEGGAKKSCLLDTVKLAANGTGTYTKSDYKLLFWIDSATGGIKECTGTTCTTASDETMNKTFKAVISVETMADNRTVQHPVSEEPAVTNPVEASPEEIDAPGLDEA